MPGLKDLAALPTSWALTMWDALPIILSVEAALVVVILATLSGRTKVLAWLATRSNIIGGLAYLTVFGSSLWIIFALFGAGNLLERARVTKFSMAFETPRSPLGGLTSRAWNVVGAVAASAALAATIRILAGPFLNAGNPLWYVLALTGGLLPLGTFGTAAVPALAISTTTDSLATGIVWLVAAALRPRVEQAVRSRRRQPVQALSDEEAG